MSTEKELKTNQTDPSTRDKKMTSTCVEEGPGGCGESNTLLSSCLDSLILVPSAEAAVGEVTELYVKGIHLLILKHQPKGQGLAGPFSGDRALVSASFALPLYSTFLAQVGGSGHNFTKAAGIAHP